MEYIYVHIHIYMCVTQSKTHPVGNASGKCWLRFEIFGKSTLLEPCEKPLSHLIVLVG